MTLKFLFKRSEMRNYKPNKSFRGHLNAHPSTLRRRRRKQITNLMDLLRSSEIVSSVTSGRCEDQNQNNEDQFQNNVEGVLHI